MRKKILVVDDHAEFVDLVSFNLKRAGYGIATASNGEEAIKKARAIAPDLILLDVMMPEMDGFEVCEILRHDSATASIPIVMVTALSSELGRMEGLGSGATDFLSKPLSPKQLLARIENLLKHPAKSHVAHDTAS